MINATTKPRIVITGMGAITPIGHSVAESWQAALSGRSGIDRITQFDASDLPCQIAGEVKNFNPRDHMSGKEARRMSRAAQLAVAALRLAQADAALPQHASDPERTAVSMGVAIGGFDVSSAALKTYWAHGWGKVSPFAVPATLPNMVTHHVSHAAQTHGALVTQVAACAAGLQSIGEGAALIQRGAADLVYAGGAEASLTEGIVAGFCAMRGMPIHYNDNPTSASRPFDAAREGFVLAEAGAMVVLERLDHALARGAPIYAEYLGHASSSDAYHMAIPDPTAAGAVRAMRWALRDAGVSVEAVDYINAHGTSTPLNGKVETLAIKTLFGERAYQIPVSSTKSVMGHAMGAAGAIESIFCVKALECGVLPPTWNYETVDPVCDLDYVPNAWRKTDPRIVLCNAFGLGGQNAAIVFGRYDPSTSRS